KGLKPIFVNIEGDTFLKRMIYSVMFADHLSLYVAANRNVDPLNVDPITAIKRNIKDRLDH
ncbi:MAG: hypothetical protein J5673_01100, partial [Candidatus Methanomethylophilaceae archaeon]|nr:hypothetical protein [Candidatus Methanomethylophilaceae archaeon]